VKVFFEKKDGEAGGEIRRGILRDKLFVPMDEEGVAGGANPINISSVKDHNIRLIFDTSDHIEGLGGEEGIVKGRVEEEDDDSDDDLENAADDEPRCTYLVTDIFLLTVLSFC
jgi:hypothetical protein